MMSHPKQIPYRNQQKHLQPHSKIPLIVTNKKKLMQPMNSEKRKKAALKHSRNRNNALPKKQHASKQRIA